MKYEYRVRYFRTNWRYWQVRYFQSRPFADRLVRKLHSHSPRWDGLEPLEWVKVERRRVGEWEDAPWN